MNTIFPWNSYHVFLFLGILFLIFWIYSLLWVAKDISWRTNSLRFQVSCIVMIAFTTPLIWLPVYFLMRPVQRFDTSTFEGDPTIWCNSCGEENNPSHEYCIMCWDKLTISCLWCDKNIPVQYLYCPFCWSPRSKVL